MLFLFLSFFQKLEIRKKRILDSRIPVYTDAFIARHMDLASWAVEQIAATAAALPLVLSFIICEYVHDLESLSGARVA